MVSQQGELVESIDRNVDAAGTHVDKAESTLSKYLDNITNDRSLVLKFSISDFRLILITLPYK